MGRKDAAPRRLDGLALSREKMSLNPLYKEITSRPIGYFRYQHNGIFEGGFGDEDVSVAKGQDSTT